MSASQLTDCSPTRVLPRDERRPGSTRRWAWLAACVTPLAVAAIWPRINAGWTGTQFDAVSGAVLVLLLAVCTYSDLSSRKIYNWVTYPALLWALFINAAHDMHLAGWLSAADKLGAIGFDQSLLGAGVCFFVLLFVYSISGGGAGDVKLAAVIGAYLGVEKGLLALALTYLIAGLAMIGWTLWKTGPIKLATALLRRVGQFFVPLWVAAPNAEEKTLLNSPVPLAGFFAVGTLLSLFEFAVWEMTF